MLGQSNSHHIGRCANHRSVAWKLSLAIINLIISIFVYYCGKVTSKTGSECQRIYQRKQWQIQFRVLMNIFEDFQHHCDEWNVVHESRSYTGDLREANKK